MPDTNTYYYSDQQLGIDLRTKELVMSRCLKYVAGINALDLGFVDGVWTKALLNKGCNVDVVEGNATHIENGKKQFNGNSGVSFVLSDFELFEPTKPYDTIVAGDIIQYIDDPVPFIKKLNSWLAKDGKLIITVPNCLSLHRRLGTLMGIEKHPSDLNKQDLHVGNLNLFDRYSLRALLNEAGIDIEELRGCFLKPTSSKLMEDWSDELLAALLEIGSELEDYCWFLYAICTRSTHL